MKIPNTLIIIEVKEGIVNTGPQTGQPIKITLGENYESRGYKSDFKRIKVVYVIDEHPLCPARDKVYKASGRNIANLLNDFTRVKELIS